MTRRTQLKPWMLVSWEPVSWQLPENLSDWPAWTDAGTSILGIGPDGLTHGEAVWVAKAGPQLIGLAWEWVEWRTGVVVLKDPMSICSNIVAPAVEGSDVRASPLLQLNRLAYALPWRETVSHLLRESRAERVTSIVPRLRQSHASVATA